MRPWVVGRFVSWPGLLGGRRRLYETEEDATACGRRLAAAGNAHVVVVRVGGQWEVVDGSGHRIRALREFIAHAKSLPGVWFATREEIADHYMKVHETHIPGQLG